MQIKFGKTGKIDRVDPSIARQRAVAAIRWSFFNAIGYTPHQYQVCAHNSWHPGWLEEIIKAGSTNSHLETQHPPSQPARYRAAENSAARYRFTISGRRGGKTEWAAHEAAAYMIAGPYKVMIGCPSYDLGYKEFRVIMADLMHENSPVRIVDVGDNKEGGNLHIKTDIGSECVVVSFDKPKKSGHGEEYDLIILSETGLMDNIGGEDGIWNKVIIGTMASRKAEVICPTTPQGQDDWLYPRFLAGLPLDSKWRSLYEIDPKKYPYDPDYLSLCWPAFANVYGFNEDVVKMKAETPPRIFEEQVLGHFVRWSGAIWINDFCFDPRVHVIDSFDIPSWWNRIEIIDPGFSGLFGWAALVTDPAGDHFIVDEYYVNRTLYDQHIADILARRKAMYGADIPDFIPVYIDPEDPRIVAEFNAKGMACIPADNDVLVGFQQGAWLFQNDHLHIFSRCKRTVESLKNHEWAKQSGASAKRKEANDKWKHFSDIVRYAANAPKSESIAPKIESGEVKGFNPMVILNEMRNKGIENWVF